MVLPGRRKYGDRMQEYKKFYQKFKDKSHLGYPIGHRANYQLADRQPENSLSAIDRCIKCGVLFLEIDLQETKDGYLVLCHDQSIDRMTNRTGKISELSLAEIKKANLYEGDGSSKQLTEQKIPTIDEVLSTFKDKALFNIDKGWEYREKLNYLLKKESAFHQVIVKSAAPLVDVREFLTQAAPDFMYMHKIFNRDLHMISEIIEDLKPQILELSFFADDEELIQPSILDKLRKHANIWVNALNVSRNNGHNDEKSLSNPAEGWGFLLQLQPNYIQTDYAKQYAAIYQKQLKL